MSTASAVAVVLAALAVLFGALWFGGGWPPQQIPGLPAPGLLTTAGLPIVRVLHDVCAVATVGTLLAAAALGGGADARREITRAAGPWALAWAATAACTQILTMSDLIGLPVGEAIESGFLPTYSMEVPQGQAFLLVTVLTVVVAIGTSLRVGTLGRVVLLAIAVFAVLPPAYVGHSASAADHNIAISSLMAHIAGVTLWVGGLFALVAHLRRYDAASAAVAVRRFSAVALCCFAIVGASGLVNAWIRLGGVAEVWQTRYGLLVLAKLAALCVLGWFGWRHRRATIATLDGAAAGDGRPGSGPFLRLAAAEAAVMACAIALAVGLSRTPPPRAEASHDQHELLGYVLPPFAPGRLLTEFRPDPILIMAVILIAAGYLVGVWRLARRGEAWPVGQVATAVAGVLVVLYAVAGGLAAYAPALFSAHALQYALVGTAGPALFALGAPLVPLREAAPSAARAAEGRHATALTHPAAATAVYGVPYLLLYVTGLFDWAQSSLAVRLAVLATLAVTGTWFFHVALGLDPLPRVIGPALRTGMLGAAVAVQVWVALVFLAGPRQGQEWYAALALPWAPELGADQRTGALIGPGTSAAVLLALIALLALRRRGARRRAASATAVAEPAETRG
ncbi:cytochrome c oxidase assembly protein [Sphaerisporangium melleum]|uniref:cytochrome c oxidase assembly protein n=1 Tax=Sphaerisporangium melleum TaxID=321316 RepID=UPI00166C30D7|nr:cytochrome c oxidase assembly protein [Sphaerisporangium melleum]